VLLSPLNMSSRNGISIPTDMMENATDKIIKRK
jgi:hypothetical protein